MMEMNNKFELISALMDDALTDEHEIQQAISYLLNDSECQKKWEEYHTLGLSLKTSPLADNSKKINHTDTKKSKLIRFDQIVKVGISLAATVTACSVGMVMFMNQNYSFTPDVNMMMSGLAEGNSKIAMSTFMTDEELFDVIDDDEYVQKQRSSDNSYLKQHENSTNTGGIIRVSFPGNNLN